MDDKEFKSSCLTNLTLPELLDFTRNKGIPLGGPRIVFNKIATEIEKSSLELLAMDNCLLEMEYTLQSIRQDLNHIYSLLQSLSHRLANLESEDGKRNGS
jgi:hypothetical protein